jgi:hypothetical protein
MDFKSYKYKYLIIFLLSCYFIIIYENIIIFNVSNNSKDSKRIGIIGYKSDINIGNNLVKYSMYMILKRLGFRPTLIALKSKKNIYFLRKYLDIEEIEEYNQLNEDKYDILVVNSDQTWSYKYKYLLEAGFLSFAKNWIIHKFVYAASLAHDRWKVSKKILKKAKILVKQFSGVSVREKSSVNIIKNILGIKPTLVLDPTFLLDKSDYLKLIENFNYNIDITENYLCTYILDNSNIIKDFVRDASKYFHYKILPIQFNVDKYIEKFIFSLNICKSMITDSFHGTVFSIIFNKPFISFINNVRRGKDRFVSLNETLELTNRVIFPKKFEENDIAMLKHNPKINIKQFNKLKRDSINFIKKNLYLV